MLNALAAFFLCQTDFFLRQSDPSVASLPLVTHILAVLGLGGGLVLWLVGQRVLKPMSGLLGGVLGGLVGFIVLPNMAPATILDLPSPYIGLGVGALFGLGAGLMLFRFALAISTAIALGLAGLLIAAAAIHFQPMQDATRTVGTLKSEVIRSAGKASDVGIPGQAATMARPVATVVREFVDKRFEEVQGAWNGLVAHDQVVLALSGTGGVAAGFFMGVFFPRKSAAIATGLLGSAVWLPCLVWILHALEVPGRHHLDRSTVFWLVTWGIVAAVGVIVQFYTESRQAPKAKD